MSSQLSPEPPLGLSQERVVTRMSGFLGLAMVLGLIVVAVFLIRLGILDPNGHDRRDPLVLPILGGILTIITAIVCLTGHFVVPPNDSRVMVLFGKYVGTVKTNGFYWANPFTLKHRVSLRARNLNGEKTKVNDKSGNPIEIAAVVVWQVRDTYAARFDVDDYLEYVETQSESAVRKLASSYDYDGAEDQMTLRGDTGEISEHLRNELEERLARAGIHVVEARITHLAYAPEIAQAMLQRQQAEAMVAARTKIVEGAVGMVEMALEELKTRGVVELDAERRVAMVSNLLVVLCGERTTPVVNTGTLYS